MPRFIVSIQNPDTAPAKDHPDPADILNRSGDTDPGLASADCSIGARCCTRVEEMFDPERQKPDPVPDNWKAPGVKNAAIPGHSFGFGFSADDKAALLWFLRSL